VLPHARVWNIAFRTSHIAATGFLLGDHFFDVVEDRLKWMLASCIVTGLCLIDHLLRECAG
jgi:hypothetical protein